ncbi:MAG: hypothetical protein QM809_11965 [Gordonia sp. (in: high G+C Gram-positive bacteria)]|uniref:hypothetical protein n=1 Tax=Gordonia sp. (in: high G+C Gram-positive bacteria) TaxID=84139 RepID=UPI0039E514EF
MLLSGPYRRHGSTLLVAVVPPVYLVAENTGGRHGRRKTMTTYRKNEKRSDGGGDLSALAFRCRRCDKVAFPSRNAARRAARTRQLHDTHSYRCPAGNGVHLGHQPESVRRGRVSSDAYALGARGHRLHRVGSEVRKRFAEVFPNTVLVSFADEFTDVVAQHWSADGRGPTWREAITPFLDRPGHPVTEFFDAPDGWKQDRWREQALLLLLETLRDDRWITFDDRPRSLRAMDDGARHRDPVDVPDRTARP